MDMMDGIEQSLPHNTLIPRLIGGIWKLDADLEDDALVMLSIMLQLGLEIALIDLSHPPVLSCSPLRPRQARALHPSLLLLSSLALPPVTEIEDAYT